ncbi:hypothetical protein BDL97_03G125600 [Sphagnum fallax]|nr:hypothetical protein BDL97_03G125600 [Sphagnum fallax]
MDWCKKLKELVQDPKFRGKLTLKLLKETEEFRRVIFYDDDVAVEASLLALIAEDTRPPTLVYQLHGNLRYAKFTIQHQNVIIQEELMIDTGCVHWKCSSLRLTQVVCS